MATGENVQVLKRYFKFKFKEMRKNGIFYAFMAPFTIVFFLFTVIPVAIGMGFSVTNFNLLETPKFIGIENYYRLFMVDDLFIIAIKNTLLLATLTGPLQYVLCFLFAWLINEMPPKFRALLTLLFYAPSISGATAPWLIAFAGDSHGWVNAFLLQLNLIEEPIQFLQDANYITPIVVLIILWMSLGASFLAHIAGLQGVNTELFEAGIIDGIRNRWQELWFITLPSMKPQLLFAAVLSITGSFSIGGQITSLVGFPSPNYELHTIMHHLEDYGNIRFEMGYASAIATLLFIVMIASNKLVRGLLRRVGT